MLIATVPCQDLVEYATEWSHGQVIDLGALPGFTESQALGINDAGQVVGLSFGPAPIPEPSTWAMMLVGFAGLGYAGYRRARQLPPIQSGHQAMYDVWRSLEGPVVNPTMVKEAMLKAKEKGAVWDGAAWSIIDRAITIDPAVMVSTTTAVTSPV